MQDQQQMHPFFDRYTTTPLLTKADEERLGALVLAGRQAQAQLDADPENPARRALQRAIREGKEAQDQFVLANTRLVMMIARRYNWAALDLDDLVQEGILGLMHTAEKFDHTKGWKFSTYATWWIRQNIGNAIEKTGRTIRLPAYADDQVRRLANIREDLIGELRREPTFDELAKAANTTAENLTLLLQTDQEVYSLDKVTGISGGGNNPTTLADLVPDYTTDPQEVLTSDLLDWQGTVLGELLTQLPEDQQKVFLLRFGKGASRTEVAAFLGIGETKLGAMERSARSRLQDIANDKKPSVGPDGLEHGIRRTYQYHGCRCNPCRHAQSLYNKKHPRPPRSHRATRRAVAVSA